MPFGFGSLATSISRRKSADRLAIARAQRRRALTMALLHYEALHIATSEAWLDEALFWEAQLPDDKDAQQ